MRVGERGSISPTGDLIAFGVALTMVVALTGILPSMVPMEEGGYHIPAGTISFFLSWHGWDRDGDGILEETALEGTGTNMTVPLDGSYLVVIEFAEKVYSFLFAHGRSAGPREAGTSVTHSVAVLIASEDRIVPGLMSISEVQE